MVDSWGMNEAAGEGRLGTKEFWKIICSERLGI